MWEYATFHGISYLPPRVAENLKAFSINFWKSAKCMSYIRFMLYVRPLKILQCAFRCLQTNICHTARKSVGQEVLHDMLDVVEECDCFLICFLKNIRYFVKHQLLQQYLNDQKMFLKLHANLAEKIDCCCVVLMYGSEHTRCFWWFQSEAVVLGLYEVYSLILQHIWCVRAQTFMSNWSKIQQSWILMLYYPYKMMFSTY